MRKLDEAQQKLLNRIAGQLVADNVEEVQLTKGNFYAHERTLRHLGNMELLTGDVEARGHWFVWLTARGWDHVTDPRIRALRKLRSAS